MSGTRNSSLKCCTRTSKLNMKTGGPEYAPPVKEDMKKTYSMLSKPQLEAIDAVVHGGFNFLCADIGTGKTVIAATSMRQMRQKNDRFLVIAPKKVAEFTWPSEFADWDHLSDMTVSLCKGSPRARMAAVESSSDVVIIGVDNVSWLFRTYSGLDFSYVLIDEIDKMTSGSDRFKALRKNIKRYKRVIGMTGTPITEGLDDIWSQFALTNPGVLDRSKTRFMNQWFYKPYPNAFNWVMRDHARQSLVDKIKPYVYRLEADPAEMPEVQFLDDIVEGGHLLKAAQTTLVRHQIIETDQFTVEASTDAVLSQKLVQLASGFIYTAEGDAAWYSRYKLTQLAKYRHNYAGTPLLVVYWFKAQEEQFDFPCLSSSTKNQQELIDKWNRGEVPVMGIHPASAGHGLNLQYGPCNRMVFLTLPWSGRLFTQTLGRLVRKGQKQPVIFVHRLIGRGTADEKVVGALAAKGLEEASILEAMKADAGE